VADLKSGLVATVLLLCLAGVDAEAQSKRTEHTYTLDDRDRRPVATLEDVGWLVGSWVGTAFDQRFEAVWNPRSAGSMVGLFKVYDDGGKVGFYELLLLIEEEDSLALRVKHFTPEFIAWEDKEDYVSFPLVRIEEDAIHFSGLSFYRIDKDTFDGYIAMRNDAGIREEKLAYRRLDTAH
jgi:hypothetical protein